LIECSELAFAFFADRLADSLLLVVSVSLVACVEASVFADWAAKVLAWFSDAACCEALFAVAEFALCEALFEAEASASVLEWPLVELLADPTPEVVRALV
jgi:hypothetical protein